MSWLNKSFSQLQDVSASISSFTQDVLAAEPPPIDDHSSDQFAEYRSQIDYYKREVERLKNGDSIESKIRTDEISRQYDEEIQKNDDLSLQVTNLAEELEESINENNKLAKRNSFLSKQSTTVSAKNDSLEKDNATLQKSLEEVDQIHEEELQEVLKQRDEIKTKLLYEKENGTYTDLSEENQQLKLEISKLKSLPSNISLPPSPTPSPDSDLKLFKNKMAKLQKSLKAKIADLERQLDLEKQQNLSTAKNESENHQSNAAAESNDQLSALQNEIDQQKRGHIAAIDSKNIKIEAVEMELRKVQTDINNTRDLLDAFEASKSDEISKIHSHHDTVISETVQKNDDLIQSLTNKMQLLQDSTHAQLSQAVSHKTELTDKLTSAELTITNLQSDLTVIPTINAENQNLLQQIELFQQERQVESRAMSELQANRDELKSSSDELSNQIAELTTTVDTTEMKYKTVLAEKSILEKEMSEAHSDQSTDADNLTQLKLKNIQVEATNQELSAEIERLGQQLNASRTKLESKLKISIDKVELLQTQLDELKKHHDSELAQIQTATDQHTNAEIEAMQTALLSKTGTIQTMEVVHRNEMNAIQEQYTELSTSKTNIEEAMDIVASQKSELENEISQLKSKLESVQQTLVSEKERKCEEEACELDMVRAELSRTLEKLEDTESAAEEAASILDQLKQVELLNHSLNEKIKLSSDEKLVLENNLQSSTKTISRLKESVSSNESIRAELEESNRVAQGLQNGNVLLQNRIATLEKEKLALRTRQVDGESDSTSELHRHINQLTSVIQQREAQLQVSIKRNNELGDDLKRMHEVHQSQVSGSSDTLLEEQLAHLEAEKEHLHQVLNEKSREARELSNRLQETGGALQMRSKQLDELATDIQEAKRVKERAEMTQEAMTKLSHLIRAKDVEIEALKNKNESLMEILRNGDTEQSVQTIKFMEKSDADRADIERLMHERDQIINAYNQLEHSVIVLKGQFESLDSSYKEEIKMMKNALNSHTKQQDITEAHELELSTLKNLVKKIRAKSMTLTPREAPDGSETPTLSNGSTIHQQNGFTDNELLTSSVRNLKERCASLEAKNTAMKRDNDALRDQLMDRREKWDALESTNQNLAKELAHRDVKLIDLKMEIDEYMHTIEQKNDIINVFERDNKELTRLREHLVVIEEDHAHEVIKIQQNESKLQMQVDALRDGLDDVTGARNDLEELQLENARDQELKEKNLSTELNDARRREKGYDKTIKELQQFIEHFRQQQELAMGERDRAHATQLQRAERESHSLRQETKQLRGRMEAAETRSNESQHLRLQLNEKDEKFERLRYIIDEKAIEVDNLRQRLVEARDAAERTLDKALAKNIVLKYLSLPSNKKSEGVKILGAIFGLSNEELHQAESAGLGWRGWFSAPTTTPTSMDPNKSFSELFMNFLEENSDESGRRSHLPSFPINEIVGDLGKQPRKISSDRDSGIEGRNTFSGNPLLAPMMPSSQKHQNALLKGLLDD